MSRRSSVSNEPKIRSKGINGKNKGAKYESEIAKILSYWTGKDFRKSYGSGAFGKQKATHVDIKKEQAGDVIADKLFPYIVECKKTEGWCLDSLLHCDRSSLVDFWNQTLEESAEPIGVTVDELLMRVRILAEFFRQRREKQKDKEKLNQLKDKMKEDRYKEEMIDRGIKKKTFGYNTLDTFPLDITNAEMLIEIPEGVLLQRICKDNEEGKEVLGKKGKDNVRVSTKPTTVYQLIGMKVPLLIFSKNRMPNYIMFPWEYVPAMKSMEFPHLSLQLSYPSGSILCILSDFLMNAPESYENKGGQCTHLLPNGSLKKNKPLSSSIDQRRKKPRC